MNYKWDTQGNIGKLSFCEGNLAKYSHVGWFDMDCKMAIKFKLLWICIYNIVTGIHLPHFGI